MCKAFYYKKYKFDPQTGELVLIYQVDDQKSFVEKIIFPNAPFSLNPEEQVAINRIFFLTHIAFGITYYKAFIPQKLVVESGVLSPEEAKFFSDFYLKGLGEFAVKNNLSLQGQISFPFDLSYQEKSHDVPLENKIFVPIGGGKDSCVTLSLLKESPFHITVFSVGNPKPIQKCADISQYPHLVLNRTIDPALLELNKTGSVLNGHVPITGLIAFLLWASALLYHHRYAVLSCERSANHGNLMQGELEINHQYSKSFQFEKDFYQLTQRITPDFRYFSLLRPLTEIHIAKLFAKRCSSFFNVFTSCNKAFKLDETKRLSHWCGCCDKCRFVFLILAPFMEKTKLIECLKINPLNDPHQIDGYRELLGFLGHKPFECVGTPDECLFAFYQLTQRKEWQEDAVIKALKDQVLSIAPKDLFNPSDQHLIPKELSYVIDKFMQ